MPGSVRPVAEVVLTSTTRSTLSEGPTRAAISLPLVWWESYANGEEWVQIALDRSAQQGVGTHLSEAFVIFGPRCSSAVREPEPRSSTARLASFGFECDSVRTVTELTLLLTLSGNHSSSFSSLLTVNLVSERPVKPLQLPRLDHSPLSP